MAAPAPAAAEGPPPPLLTNLAILEWLRRSDDMMTEHKMIHEKWQQFVKMHVECSAQNQKSIEQLVDRFAEHQRAIAQLLDAQFARVESLHNQASQSLNNEFHRAMNNPARHVGAVDSPTCVAPAIEVTAPVQDFDRQDSPISPTSQKSVDSRFSIKQVASRELINVRAQRAVMAKSRNDRLFFAPDTYRRLSTPPDTRFARWIESDIANLVVGCLITGNAITSSLAISIQMHGVLKNPTESPNTAVFATVSDFFTFVFAAEVCLRIVVLQTSYFFGQDWRWNLFDLILTGNGIGQKIAVGASKQFIILRIMRVCRVTRIFRIIRVLRYFTELRLLICSLSASIMSLLWAMVLVVLIIFIAAVVFMQGLLSHMEELTPPEAAEFVEQSQLREWYSSVPQTMYSLLMAVSGGKPWSVFSAPLEASSPTLPVLFCALVIFIGYGVFSIIVGVLVDRTAGASNSDLQLTLHREVDKVDTFLRHIRSLFHEAGWKHQDSITSEEFKSCLMDRTMQLYLTSHGIDHHEAKAIFANLLSQESFEGAVTVDDFAYSCLEHMGQAKSTDVQRLLADTSKILNSALRTGQSVQEQHATLVACVNTLTSQFAIVRHELEELHNKH